MSEDLDWIARAGAKPKGGRPDFLGSPHEEKMLSMLMALVAEVSVVRERLDTVERLLEEKGTISRADIEGCTPDLETGIGSPVIMDSSTELRPSIISPSTGILSPGTTLIVSLALT